MQVELPKESGHWPRSLGAGLCLWASMTRKRSVTQTSMSSAWALFVTDGGKVIHGVSTNCEKAFLQMCGPALCFEGLLALQHGLLEFDEDRGTVRIHIRWRVMGCDSRRLGFMSSVHQKCRITKLLTKPRPSRTASTTPAGNDEQLSWLMSRGTEMLRVMGGSLSMIMSNANCQNGGREAVGAEAARTFVRVLDALLDGVCGFAEYALPDLCVYGHERGEKTDFAFWCFGRGLVAPHHEL